MALRKDIEDVFTCGDDVELQIEVPDIPTGQALMKAWFTVKRILPEADPGLLQKVLTTTNAAGVGQITDDGAGDTVGKVRVDLTPTDSALMSRKYKYGVKVRTSAGKVYTAVYGDIKGLPATTDAIS